MGKMILHHGNSYGYDTMRIMRLLQNGKEYEQHNKKWEESTQVNTIC